MPRGGKRAGAGRKALENRPTKVHVETATERIDLLQPRAVKALEDALSATTTVSRINGRDEKGAPTYEYVTVPDHQVRVSAAKSILNKRIPDVARTELTGKDGEKIEFVFTDYATRSTAPAKAN